jgi:hypothetical protein
MEAIQGSPFILASEYHSSKEDFTPVSRKIAEFAYDLHAGLAIQQVAEFDDLQTIGMAA